MGHEDTGSNETGGHRDERKLVTVLFADLAGFTAFSEGSDPEEVRDLLNGLFDVLVPCVESQGGRVDKFLGDALMALFGAPVAHRDDADRAVRAALAMREAVAGFDQERGTPFSLHIGINTGRVVAGSVGSGRRLEYTVIGDAVNVAKRLEEASAEGEILVGEATRRLLSGAFLLEPAGAVPGGGREAAVRAFRVLGADPLPIGRLARAARLTRFVGRTEALGLVERALGSLAAGVAGALFVCGESGVGKSRLLLEARGGSAGRAFTWLELQAAEPDRSLGHVVVAQMILREAGVLPDDDLECRADKVEAHVRRLFGGEAADALVTARALLGWGPPGSRGADPESDAGVLGARSARWLRGYLSRLALERPVVVVIEDAQWLDAPSLEAIEGTLADPCLDRVLFCFVGRDLEGAVEGRLLASARSRFGGSVATLRLDPLAAGETEELLQDMLGGGPLPPGLGPAAHRRAAGNPLFAEEIVRHLVGVGALVHDGGAGRWVVERALADGVVPDSIQGVVAARIDSLPPESKRCLGLAAVVGATFDTRVLARMTEGDGPADPWLADLAERSFIVRGGSREDAAAMFNHALVHEAAYESLLRSERREYHERCARAYESVFADRLEEHAGVLAYHWTRAEEWDRARRYLVLAGERSAGIAGDAEAVGLYREAMVAFLMAFEQDRGPGDGDDAVGWFVDRIEPFYEARQLGALAEAVERFYRSVRQRCGAGDARTVAAASILGASYLHRGMNTQARRLLESTIEEWGTACDPPGRPAVRVLVTLGLACLHEGDVPEAERHLESALALQREDPDPDPRLLGECYLYLSGARYYAGRHHECRRLVEEALRSPVVVRGPRHPELMLNLSNCLLLAGDVEGAARWARKARRRSSSSYLRALADLHLGMVEHARSWFGKAEALFREALRSFEGLGRADETAEAVLLLAEALLQDGRPSLAGETAVRALRLVESAEGPQGWSVSKAYWTLAGVDLAEGRLREAELRLVEAEALAERRVARTDPFWAELLFRRALVRRRTDHRESESDYLRALDVLRGTWGNGHPRSLAMETAWAAWCAATPEDGARPAGSVAALKDKSRPTGETGTAG